MHLLNSSEYWARAGSLPQTTTDGRHALPEVKDTRLSDERLRQPVLRLTWRKNSSNYTQE